jgi:hypothetical protein
MPCGICNQKTIGVYFKGSLALDISKWTGEFANSEAIGRTWNKQQYVTTL